MRLKGMFSGLMMFNSFVLRRLNIPHRYPVALLSTKKSFPPFLLDEKDVTEIFSKGGGPGGQSINKTSNRVRLTHIPTGITVVCQDFRDLHSNRKHALTILRQKVEFHLNGADSKLGRKIDKIRKQKAKKKQRTKKKQCTSDGSPIVSDDGGDQDDEVNCNDLDDCGLDDIDEFINDEELQSPINKENESTSKEIN